MSFRKPTLRPPPSRRPSRGEPGTGLLSAGPASDEPLRGVKAGRVSVLADGAAFTALHAGGAGGRAVAYAPQAVR